jgi:dihydroneopterin aldolase
MNRFTTKVFVRGLEIGVEIGVNPDERGRRQPLVLDIELEVGGEPWRGIAETVNYERIAQHARVIADQGHIGLVETFAWRIASACVAEPHVVRAVVRVEKPEALAPHAKAAGVEVVAERT